MPDTTFPKVYEHPVSGDAASKVLEPLLPCPLSLYNRLQFQHRSPSSHILATFPATITSEADLPKCFAIAFIDRTRRPETECWIFLSSEIPSRCPSDCSTCTAALLALICALATLEVPDSVHNLDKLAEGNPLLSHATDNEILLVGALHEHPKKLLEEAGLLAVEHPGAEIPYMNYLFQPSTLPSPRDLPPGFHWGAVHPRDFPLIRSRTQIPRQDATLALLPSLAIYPSQDDEEAIAPIAWAFLGLDGSLTSLHTESQYRGHGLAKILTSAIFSEGGYGDTAGGPRCYWSNADVALDNTSSRAVCRGLGGEEGWVVYWVRVSLKRARALPSSP